MKYIIETWEDFFEVMDEYYEYPRTIHHELCIDGKIYDTVGCVISDPNKYYHSVEEYWNDVNETYRKEIEENNVR